MTGRFDSEAGLPERCGQVSLSADNTDHGLTARGLQLADAVAQFGPAHWLHVDTFA